MEKQNDNDKHGLIPQSVLDDDKQRTMYYNQSLPYAHLLDGEAQHWLQDICTNLVICVKAQDFAPGASSWVKRLNSYLDMKHTLNRDMRAKFGKLLFELTITPGMDTALVEAFANCCIRLIRKPKRLGPEDLVLPWRPLYELVDRKHMGSVLRLIENSQRYFSPSAIREILDEFLPQFTTHSVGDAIKAQGYLVLFLPVVVPRNSITHEPLATDVTSPRDYLPTIFSMWSIFTYSNTYDAQFTDLVSRVAEHNLDTTQPLDIGLFTKQQIREIFTVCLRMMNLPVGSRSDGGGNSTGGATTGFSSSAKKVDMKAGNALFLRRKPEKFRALARFIVYTMVPEQKEDGTETCYTLSLLADLIQAVELYCHPSNHGAWAYVLTSFAKHLASTFLKRWGEEQEEDCQLPRERRLTPALRKEFVQIIRPVAYLSMFGKDQYTVGASQSTMKYLSWLEPSLILPGLLERVYPSLETLTETHRTSSALSTLSDIALPLLSRDHYPAGGKHLLPLLHLATPGIDMNDPIKTIAALMFISTSIMVVPVRDLSGGGIYYNPAVDNRARYDGMDIDDVDSEVELPREAEDQLCKATTGEFEEWLAKFLRRVFTIFENVPQHDRKKEGGAMEAGLLQMLLHACDVVFGQLSDQLYDLALRMVVDFINDQVLPNAVRAAGGLCDSIASANCKKAAKKLIPLCIANIKTELEHGASSTITNSVSSNPIQSDSTFHWYQNILYSLLPMGGQEILVYKEDLVDIGLEMVNKCRSRRGIMWTGKFIRHCLKGLLDTYPKDFKSLNPDEWNNPESIANSHLLWGKPGNPEDLQIDWHVPSEEEKDFALEWLDTFLSPSIARLRELMSDDPDIVKPNTSHELTNEFCRHLAVVRNCLIGSAMMVGDDGLEENVGDKDGTDGDEDTVSVNATRRLIAGYAFTDPADPRTEKARNIRKAIGEFIHEAAVFFKTRREDDVESVKILIKIIKSFLADRGVEKLTFENNKNGYSYAKHVGRTPLSHKRYPRNLLVRRAYNHHLLRLRQNVHGRIRAPLHDDILQDLLDFSLSSYAEIRKMSQTALSGTSRNFVGSKKVLMPTVLDALQPNEEAVDKAIYSNRLKGALYLLTHRSFLMTCLRDWRFIPRFVLSICGAQHEDKLSVQELIRRIFVDYVSHFNSFSFKVLYLSDMDDTLKSICDDSDIKRQVDTLRIKVQERQKTQLVAYQDMVQSLVRLVEDKKIHWRFATMAANFVELFLRPDIAPNAELVGFANKCVHSELPALRRIGIGATTQLLLYIKVRSLAQGNDALLIMKKTRHPLKRELSTKESGHDITQMLLSSSYQPLTKENADRSFLVDSAITGWYVWPEKYTAYVACTDDSQLPKLDEASRGAYEELRKSFTSEEYWTKLFGYMSQETNRPHEDVFGQSNARLYSSIFQTFQDEPVPFVKSQIEALCGSADQKSRQRAAAEILGGLIRGTKHWNLSKSENLWLWLGPLLRKTLAGVTPDSLSYWKSFVRFCAIRRDPRRLRPLIDLIFEAEFDPKSDAAFAESRKLSFVRTLFVALKWRAAPLSSQCLSTYFANVQHPYKQVRETIGENINEIMQVQWTPSVRSVEELLANNSYQSNDGVGNVPIVLDTENQIRLDKLLSDLDKWLQTIDSAASIGSSDYANASKTVLAWLHEALTHWRVAGTLPFVIPFVPKLFSMQEMKDDQDLQRAATRVLNLVVRISYPPSIVPVLVDQFVSILTKSTSWHIRVRALPILQIFFFKHLFVMDGDQVLRIMQVIGDMLLDSQIEVRQMAAVTLGGLVRCSQRDAITSLKSHYSALLDTKIPKRKRDDVTGKVIEPAGFREAVLKKHAGALGLSCLVNAFPYEVPKWMPDVLCRLAGCMSDPAEIQSTIRKTFSDFRRTHSDTWHEDMTKFTEDQLAMLSDMLISPSYYA
ncbi:hypothetical protein DFQ30_004302 [Apophysomyces sp. BC1015]|nr:hypothetical protein DFQ30_004302 [Apophysomyces sp. BC1015]